MYKLIQTIFVFLLFLSCNTQQKKSAVVKIKDESSKNTYFTDVFNIEKVIPLKQKNKEGIFNTIMSVKISDLNIFVFSGKEVLLFDNEGNFIRTIGKRGNGPKELNKPSDFDISPDGSEVAIWDNLRNTLNIYNTQGKHIRQYSPKLRNIISFKWLNHTKFVFNSSYKSQGHTFNSIYFYNTNQDEINSDIPFPEQHEGYSLINYSTFPVVDNEQCFLSPLESRIYNLKDKSNLPRIELDFEGAQITKELLDKHKGETLSLIQQINKEEINLILGFYELRSGYITTYQARNQLFTNLINKENNLQLKISHYNPFDLFSDLIPYGIKNNTLVCVGEPYRLIEKFKHNGNLIKKTRNSDHKAYLNHLTNLLETDNPVIFLLSPKNINNETK